MPTGQRVQVTSPASEKVPAVQFKHLLSPSLEKVPSGQGKQTEKPAGEYVPAGHILHWVAPDFGEYFPAVQFVH